MKKVKLLLSVLAFTVLFSVATPVTVVAQNSDNVTRSVDDDDDDGFNWGMLGFLGLLGLLGLRRKDVDEPRRVAVNRPQ